MKLVLILASTVLLASRPTHSPAQPIRHPDRSLCHRSERVIFSCQLETKTVSICGQMQQGRAVYRFGRPGHVELSLTTLHYASPDMSTEELVATFGAARYIVYWLHYYEANPNYDPDKPMNRDTNDDRGVYRELNGLIVQQNGAAIFQQACREPDSFDTARHAVIPDGPPIDISISGRERWISFFNSNPVHSAS